MASKFSLIYCSNIERLICALLPFHKINFSFLCSSTNLANFLYPIPKYSADSVRLSVYFCHQGSSNFCLVLIIIPPIHINIFYVKEDTVF